MKRALIAAAFVAFPLNFASAQEPVDVVQGGEGQHKITIEKMAFQTPEIKIKAGESVTWTNQDGMAHNVHLRAGPAKGKPYAQGKMLNKGESYTLKFNTAGDYGYVCSPHPMMKAKVIVE